MPRLAPTPAVFMRRLRRAQRRQWLQMAGESAVVGVACVALATAWHLSFGWAALASVCVVLVRRRDASDLKSICERFDRALARGQDAREDRVLCAYELAESTAPLVGVIVEQGCTALDSVPLPVVAPLQPRPYALALAGLLGLVTMLPWFLPATQERFVEPNVGGGSNAAANKEAPRRNPSSAEVVTDVVSGAFTATPALPAVGEAIAHQDVVALGAAIDAVKEQLPTHAAQVAASLAIASHELAQRAREATPEQVVPGDENNASEPGTEDSEEQATNRTLERLERGLDEAEDACARDPEACAQAMESVKQQLQPLAAGRAEARHSEPEANAQTKEARGEPGPAQGALPGQAPASSAGTSGKERQAPTSPPLITGVATQDLGVTIGAPEPDRALRVNGARGSPNDGGTFEARLPRYPRQAEAVVAKAALPHARRATVRTYFERLRPQHLAGGTKRE